MAGDYDIPKWWALPALGERLARLNGGTRGYKIRTRAMMEAAPGGRAVNPAFLGAILKAVKPAPLWVVIVLTRIALEQPLMSGDDAMALAGEFFTTTDPRKEAESNG